MSANNGDRTMELLDRARRALQEAECLVDEHENTLHIGLDIYSALWFIDEAELRYALKIPVG